MSVKWLGALAVCASLLACNKHDANNPPMSPPGYGPQQTEMQNSQLPQEAARTIIVRVNVQSQPPQVEYAEYTGTESLDANNIQMIAPRLRWQPMGSSQVIDQQGGYPSQPSPQWYFIRNPQNFVNPNGSPYATAVDGTPTTLGQYGPQYPYNNYGYNNYPNYYGGGGNPYYQHYYPPYYNYNNYWYQPAYYNWNSYYYYTPYGNCPPSYSPYSYYFYRWWR